MASAYLRGTKWYLRYRDNRGRWCTKACGARTKGEAKRLAAELDRQQQRQRFGLEAMPPEDGGGSVGDLLRWWLETYSKTAPSHERNVYTVAEAFPAVSAGRPETDRACARTHRELPSAEGTVAFTPDAEPPSAVPADRVQLRQPRWSILRRESGRCRRTPKGTQAKAGLPSRGRSAPAAQRSAPEVGRPVRDGHLHRASEGRTAGAAQVRPRLPERAGDGVALVRSRHEQGPAGGGGSDGRRARAVPAHGHRPIPVRAGVPAPGRLDDERGREPRGRPAACHGTRGHGPGLLTRLPQEGLRPCRGAADSRERRCPTHGMRLWPKAIHRPNPLSRPPPHDRQPAPDGRREPGSCPAHPSPQRPPHHDRGLRAPPAGLPPVGDRPPRPSASGQRLRVQPFTAEHRRSQRFCYTLATGGLQRADPELESWARQTRTISQA